MHFLKNLNPNSICIRIGWTGGLDMTENKLRHETSPYLLQHADNPVHWRPWGLEAFEQAGREDKPVFLSVGYSSCHWCHVMAHESFEHEGVAEILNRHFVSVKVDREERPDIDGLYLQATQMLTGRGGWPNSVFLLPDQRPFYAGTYWPREDRGGYAGFLTLLRNIVSIWRDKRSDVREQATQITSHLGALERLPEPKAPTAGDPFKALCGEWRERFDTRHGGFDGAPKFPPHQTLLTLLGHPLTEETEHWIRRTLDGMALGGIRDQAGGAFHRYATDERWFLPHFEVMLYDNAQLAEIYGLAAERLHEERYVTVCRGICDAMLRDFRLESGSFASAWDADTIEGEGAYYLWKDSEIDQLLGDRAAAFKEFFQVKPNGNAIDEATGRPLGENILDPVRFPHPDWDGELNILLEHRRAHRRPPLRDDKALAAWNGLMIRGLAVAGGVLGDPKYLEAAETAAESILCNNRDAAGRLTRSWRKGRAQHRAVLEDYTFLAYGMLALPGENWSRKALELLQEVEKQFRDPKGGYYQTAEDAEKLLIRQRDPFDSATPSAIGISIQAWRKLGKIHIAERLLKAFGDVIDRNLHGTQSLWT